MIESLKASSHAAALSYLGVQGYKTIGPTFNLFLRLAGTAEGRLQFLKTK